MIAVISFSLNNKAQCQKVEKASENEAIVYFVKSTVIASAVTFNFFDSDQCIGKFKGQGYFIYRCEPGEHVFWVSKEFANFMTADLNPGHTYLVGVYATTGVLTANPIISPISAADIKNITKALKILKKKDPKTFSEEELSGWTEKHQTSITESMAHFRKKANEGADFKNLAADMALPNEYIMTNK